MSVGGIEEGGATHGTLTEHSRRLRAFLASDAAYTKYLLEGTWLAGGCWLLAVGTFLRWWRRTEGLVVELAAFDAAAMRAAVQRGIPRPSDHHALARDLQRVLGEGP